LRAAGKIDNPGKGRVKAQAFPSTRPEHYSLTTHMIHYYINPETKELIVYNEANGCVAVYPRLSIGDSPRQPVPPPKPPKKSPSKTKRKRQSEEDGEETPAAKNRFGVDETTIKHIKGLYADGKSMREIKDITGVSYPTIYKYTTLERKQREREEDDGLNDDLEPEPEDDGMDDEDNF
jgi:hypothetical protein